MTSWVVTYWYAGQRIANSRQYSRPEAAVGRAEKDYVTYHDYTVEVVEQEIVERVIWPDERSEV